MPDLKLTPTTKDILPKRRGRPPKGNGAPIVAVPHVEPPHEPLPGEPFVLPSLNTGNVTIPGAILPPSPAIQAIPAVEPQPLKVALVGTAPSSRMLAPFNDPTWEIWVCSPGNMNIIPRATRWFEIHANLMWEEHKSYGEPYVKWLNENKFPKGTYMQDQSLVPHAITFPKDELVKDFGPYFFTSSFAWMMALAIKEGAKEIGLYGVDMASRDEYILQRAGGHYFIQLAKDRGIKVILPFESDLEQPPALYGYAEATPFGRKLHARETELKNRVANMEQQLQSLDKNLTYLKGALEDLDYVKSIWLGVQEGTR